jgi:hypothetical protein
MLTAYFARLLGLWALLTSICMLVNPASVSVLFQSPASVFATGLVLVVVGLAIVLAHNVWSGGVLQVVVTILGWLTLLKGLHFLLMTPSAQAAFYDAIHYDQYSSVYGGIGVVIGLVITIAGFRTANRVTAP